MLYVIISLIVWMTILLTAWHDYEKDGPKTIDDIWEVILIGGGLGGIVALIWPVTLIAAGMLLISRWIYKGYTNWNIPNLEG